MRKWQFIVGIVVVMGMSGGLFAQEEQNAVRDITGPGNYNITAYDRGVQSKLGGYFATEYISSNSTGNFKAHYLILQASAYLHRNIFFNTELELEYGALVNNGTNDGEIKIEQAWLDFLMTDWLVLRAGTVLVPFGRLNILHDADVRETTDRGLYATYVVPTTWMDTGVGFHGIVDLGDTGSLNYETYILNGLREINGTLNKVRNARPSFKADNNRAKAWASRIGYSPAIDLEVGMSYFNGKTDSSETQNLNMIGLDGDWKTGPFEWVAEWAQSSVTGGGSFTGTYGGYYIEGRYHFFPDFLKNTFLGNDYRNPLFTTVVRYSAADMDYSVVDANDLTRWTVGLNYRPVQTMVLKFESQWTRTASTGETETQFLASAAVGF
mgnify:CR=1 FL=1